jgi:fumarylacetoacetase
LTEELASVAASQPIVPQSEVDLHLAWDVADYVDFYSSRHHAENVGRIFRPEADPLPDNWLHLPVAYHGRAGTVVVDGTPINRPHGQYRRPDGGVAHGPTTKLDFELELGFVLGGPTRLGEPVPIERAADHIFGVVLVNDWSARDIQSWEYRPLGPFLGKSFATSVSAWVVPLTSLGSAWTTGPVQDPEPLPYLRSDPASSLSIDLEVWLRPAEAEQATMVASVDAAEGLYWNPLQQLAHSTVNGATVRAGDLFASGTVSGPLPHQRGSLLEATWGGSAAVDIDGIERTFLEDGDTVELRGSAPAPNGERVPLGPVTGSIVERTRSGPPTVRATHGGGPKGASS